MTEEIIEDVGIVYERDPDFVEDPNYTSPTKTTPVVTETPATQVKTASVAFLELSEDGIYVLGNGFAAAIPPNAIPSPDPINPFRFDRCHVVNGELVERPSAPRPEAIETGGYRIENCPVGTIITIRDLIGREEMVEIVTTEENPVFEFELPDAGEYEIEVDAPLPHIDTKTRIEVA